MAWTTPTNVTASSVASSSHMNTEVIANLAHLYAMLGSESAWTAYTPTDSNITVGDGTRNAAYLAIGKTVFFRYRLILGSTSAIGSNANIGLPTGVQTSAVVSAYYGDTGTRNYVGVCVLSGSQGALIHTESGSGNVTATTPFTWVAGDVISVSGVYQSS